MRIIGADLSKLSVAANLRKRFERYRPDMLRSLSDFAVPFDNNRAIRRQKHKQKTFGALLSNSGNRSFRIVQSYLAPSGYRASTFSARTIQLFMDHQSPRETLIK